MSEIDHFFRGRAGNDKLKQQEQDQLLQRIIKHILPIELQYRTAHYRDLPNMWVEVDGREVVTWPVVRGLDSDEQNINLLQDGRLMYVERDALRSGVGRVTRTVSVDDMGSRSLPRLLEGFVLTGCATTREFTCFLRPEPWALAEREKLLRRLSWK